MDVITFGETMVLMIPNTKGSLEIVSDFRKGLAGAESNVAIGLSRLGHQVAWNGRLGNDSFGRFIYKTLRGEGVDVSHVQFDDSHPTGVFFKEFQLDGRTHAHYYRCNSAASLISPETVSLSSFANAKYLFITGITPALSILNQNTVLQSVKEARKLGIKVVFDPNIRHKLWSSQESVPVLKQIASQADIVLPGCEEGAMLTGYSNEQDIAQSLLENGTGLVVVKLGEKGAYYQTATTKGYVDGFTVKAVDEVGAGDAFAAGLLSGLLDREKLVDAVKRACLLGALAVTSSGDYDGLPYREDLAYLMSGKLQPSR
jgi:2-dehydro-3-deoxygluconokinase